VGLSTAELFLPEGVEASSIFTADDEKRSLPNALAKTGSGNTQKKGCANWHFRRRLLCPEAFATATSRMQLPLRTRESSSLGRNRTSELPVYSPGSGRAAARA
jgi:hypothetical protein